MPEFVRPCCACVIQGCPRMGQRLENNTIIVSLPTTMQTPVSNPREPIEGVIRMRSTSPVLTFEKVLRAYGTGGFTYTEVVAQLERLLAVGASPAAMLEILR